MNGMTMHRCGYAGTFAMRSLLNSKQNLFMVCQSGPAGITACDERIKRGLAVNHDKGKEDPLLRNRNKDLSGQEWLIPYCTVSSLQLSDMC